jgi:hypothetical protein
MHAQSALVAGRSVRRVELARRGRPVEPQVGVVDAAGRAGAEFHRGDEFPFPDRNRQDEVAEHVGTIPREHVRLG